MTPLLLHLAESSPEPLRSQIVRQVRGRILSGDVPEGARLATAHRLAREHRVSVREVERAFLELHEGGLLERDGEGGYRVASIPPEARRALAQRRLLEDLQHQELSLRELELARDIQRRLLPPARLEGAGVAVSSRWLPARFVAGDLYDVHRLAGGGLGVVVADVAGKGIGASLLMASVKAVTPFVAAENDVPGTLRALTRRLAGDLSRGQFVALVYARIAPGGDLVEVANAGMPDPLLVDSSGVTPVAVPGERYPLGIRADSAYESVTLPLREGARLLFHSDGLPEALTPSGEPFGYEALTALLARSMRPDAERLPLDAWLDAILEEVEARTGTALSDDWTAVALERALRGNA